MTIRGWVGGQLTKGKGGICNSVNNKNKAKEEEKKKKKLAIRKKINRLWTVNTSPKYLDSNTYISVGLTNWIDLLPT